MSDLISRQAMIDAMRRHRALFCKNRIEFMTLPKDEKARVDEIDNCISDLLKAPDAELEVFEFCASGENPCKEYDQEKHCCHRWTKVIRQTVDEMKAESERKWIPITEALPIDGSLVIACSPYGGITIAYFKKGISQEDRTKMKNGEIDDPSEETWCLSEGYSKIKRSDLFKEEDEWGNNQKAYAWQYGPYHYSGQDFVAWMPLPEPWRGE